MSDPKKNPEVVFCSGSALNDIVPIRRKEFTSAKAK